MQKKTKTHPGRVAAGQRAARAVVVAESGAGPVAAEGRALGPARAPARALAAPGAGLRPHVEYVEVGHALHALGQVVVQRGEELVVAQLRVVYLLLVEGRLRRLRAKNIRTLWSFLSFVLVSL